MGELKWLYQSSISTIHNILDIACGPGGWVLQVAKAYLEIEPMDIDLSIRMIMYAGAQTLAYGLKNARFRLMDALKPLLADQSFDLVSACLLFAFMSSAA